MIRRSLLMTQDNQQTLVERVYLNALLGKCFDMDRLVAKLDSVDKEAVQCCQQFEVTSDLLYGRVE